MITGIPKEVADVIQADQFDPELRDRIVAWTKESFSLFLYENENKIVKKLRSSTDIEVQRDLGLELVVARMFLRSGCKVTYEPNPQEQGGPDFLIEFDNDRFYCEVTRIRHNPNDYSEPQEAQISEKKCLVREIPYDPKKQFRIVGDKICEKLFQVVTGCPNVIYIDSDRDTVHREFLERAIRELFEEARSGKTAFFVEKKFKDEHDFLERMSACSAIILDYLWKDSGSNIPAMISNPMAKHPLSSTMCNVIHYAIATPFRFRHNTPFVSVAKEDWEAPVIQPPVVHTKEHEPDTPQEQKQPERYPLRGKLVRYIDPFESVAEDDWEALK